MKKNYLKILTISLIMVMCCAFTIQASGTMEQEGKIQKYNKRSTFLTNGGNKAISSVYGETRGSIISTATIMMTDEGEGQIDVIIETLGQKISDEIQHTAILEMKDGDGTWFELARYEFKAVKEDYPDQKFSGLTNEFKVKNLVVDRYYRLRGIHFVWLDGKSQAFTTKTDELLLKKYPG